MTENAAVRLEPGDAAPPLGLTDDHGDVHTWKDHAGQRVVLYVYPAAMTPGCTTQACDFRDNMNRVKAMGAELFGISRDNQKSHQNFIAKQELPFRLLSDPEKTLLTPLGAFGKKRMYGKEVEGIIRSTFLIDPKGVIQHAWPKVSVKGHVEEVLKVLKELSG